MEPKTSSTLWRELRRRGKRYCCCKMTAEPPLKLRGGWFLQKLLPVVSITSPFLLPVGSLSPFLSHLIVEFLLLEFPFRFSGAFWKWLSPGIRNNLGVLTATLVVKETITVWGQCMKEDVLFLSEAAELMGHPK